jgi:hypothetical protein
MTPQPIRQSGTDLTEEQFGELLSASSCAGTSPAEAHLDTCAQCATEFAQLRDSLSLFRQATTSYAGDHLRPMTLPARPYSPASERVWWTAAATLVLAAILPMQALRQHTQRAAPSAVSAQAPVQDDTADSDDQTLLEDISTVTAASVPTPMQALADPISTNLSSTQNSTQRKD